MPNPLDYPYVEVREENPEPPRNVMKIFLKQFDGHVYICAEDRWGIARDIACIYSNGMRLVTDIPKETGWNLEKDGSLHLLKE